MSEAKEGAAGNGNGASTAPVYLRLQKRAETESKRPRTNKESAVFRRLSVAFLVVVCVACTAWLVGRYVDGAPRFELHRVELRNATYVVPGRVEAVFRRDQGKSVYEIPLEERRQEIERIPWVDEATVTRVLPDRISVAVRERVPVAFLWTRRGVLLIDGDGVILETPDKVSWAFPVLRGVSDREPAEKRKARMRPYLAMSTALRTESGALPQEISEVDLSNPQNVVVVVADSAGALKLHLGKDAFAERYEIFRSHIHGWRQQFPEVQSIDLRYEGQVVIQAGAPLTLPLESNSGAKPSAEEERSAQPSPPASSSGAVSAASVVTIP
jgi:cell division protein FtsQ